MSIITSVNNFFNHWQKKYSEIKKVQNKFANDFKELFQYGALSFDKLIYQSNGVVGICSDFKNYSNDFPKRLSFVGENIRTLDDIIRSKYCDKKDIPSPENLNKIIELKNKYFWKNSNQLQDIVQNETNIYVDNIESLLKKSMSLKVNNSVYSNLSRLNYDSRIAPVDMKNEIIKSYATSNKTLKELSSDLEAKYGMYVSASTISVNARKYLSNQGLDFKNRREAKKYYKNGSIF
jgi:hypothetical protein